jgi:hypothetical protein
MQSRYFLHTDGTEHHDSKGVICLQKSFPFYYYEKQRNVGSDQSVYISAGYNGKVIKGTLLSVTATLQR